MGESPKTVRPVRPIPAHLHSYLHCVVPPTESECMVPMTQSVSVGRMRRVCDDCILHRLAGSVPCRAIVKAAVGNTSVCVSLAILVESGNGDVMALSRVLSARRTSILAPIGPSLETGSPERIIGRRRLQSLHRLLLQLPRHRVAIVRGISHLVNSRAQVKICGLIHGSSMSNQAGRPGRRSPDKSHGQRHHLCVRRTATRELHLPAHSLWHSIQHSTTARPIRCVCLLGICFLGNGTPRAPLFKRLQSS